MPKLYSSDHIIKILCKHGFVFVSQRGSHVKYRKTANPTLTAIIPANRKEIPLGTFQSILSSSSHAGNNPGSVLSRPGRFTPALRKILGKTR